jgi:hypothetical protein
MRSRLRGPLAKTLPVSAAGEAIVEGIENRAKTVAQPPFVRVVQALRGVISGAVDREVQRHVPEVMARFEAERQRTGEPMSKPVGAGGAAAMRSAAERTGDEQPVEPQRS